MNRIAKAVGGALLLASPSVLGQDTRCIDDGFGQAVCGYGCTVDGFGHGHCSQLPGAICIVGGDGHAACGFHCVNDGFGHAVCADSPDGSCGVGGNGHGSCTRFFAPEWR